MWLVHSSGEEGWHIPQVNQVTPCDLLVFVRNGQRGWETKLWKNTETHIRAQNYEEERQDEAVMRSAGFLLGFAQQPQSPQQTQPQAPAQEQQQEQQQQPQAPAQEQQQQPQAPAQEQERAGIWSRISSAVSGLGRIIGLNR